MPRKGTVLSDAAAANQKEAIKRWHKENTVVISLRVGKEKAEEYRAYARSQNRSMTSLFCQFYEEKMNSSSRSE